MNVNRDSFFADLLQNLGFIAAIAVAISQYTLDERFKNLFIDDSRLFSAASLVALVLSIALILGIFSHRFYLLNKIYFSSKKKEEYYEYLRNIAPQNPQDSNTIQLQKKGKEKKPVPEPWYFTMIHLAFVLLVVSALCFFLLTSKIPELGFFTQLIYIVFICSLVSSISLFSIQLYRENEYKRYQQNCDEIIFNKIRERFTEKIKVFYDSTDPNLLFSPGPDRHIIFEYQNQTYQVFTRSTNPNSYFLLSPYSPTPVNESTVQNHS